MKLSLKTEYACRVLAQLGRHFGNEELSHIENLAEAEKIPANYLVQILNDLKNSGLIHSRRGKQGGYSLARHPGSVTLLDIIRAMEGEILESSRQPQGESGQRVQEIWKQMAESVAEKAGSINLEDLMVEESEEMYYI